MSTKIDIPVTTVQTGWVHINTGEGGKVEYLELNFDLLAASGTKVGTYQLKTKALSDDPELANMIQNFCDSLTAYAVDPINRDLKMIEAPKEEAKNPSVDDWDGPQGDADPLDEF